MDFQRMILFGALGMVLLLLWQSWLEYESGKKQHGFQFKYLYVSVFRDSAEWRYRNKR